MKSIHVLMFAATLAGCTRPPEAPAELNELSAYLYRSWGAENEAEREVGLDSLIDFLEGVDLEGALNDRSWELTPLTPDDLWDIRWPEERDPADVLGVAVARQSTWAPDAHAMLQIQEDQLPAEPSANSYVRSIDISDPTCFPEQSCEVIFTVNEVTRQNLLISVDFTLYKDFRWVETSRGPAMMGRSYVDQVWVGNGGNNSILQSYSCDIWLPDGNGGAWRYQTLWSESDVAASDALTIATLKASIDNILETGDEVITEMAEARR